LKKEGQSKIDLGTGTRRQIYEAVGNKKEQPNNQPDTPCKEHGKEDQQSTRWHKVCGIHGYQLFGTKGQACLRKALSA
jgi:hypothetical protein